MLNAGPVRNAALIKNLTGRTFGRLVVLGQAPSIPSVRGARWHVRCGCGVETVMNASNLTRGARSCGCTRRHGQRSRGKRGPLYSLWRGMVNRCTQRTATQYKYYGGRGIRVCERWRGRDGFANFAADVGERPDGAWLDRIDPNGDYEPGNVRWASPLEQQRNKRLSAARVAAVLDSYREQAPGLVDALRKELLG